MLLYMKILYIEQAQSIMKATHHLKGTNTKHYYLQMLFKLSRIACITFILKILLLKVC